MTILKETQVATRVINLEQTKNPLVVIL